MAGLVKLIGIVMLVAGVIGFVKPNLVKKLAHNCAQKNQFQICGIVAITLGIIFLFAAQQCSVSWLVLLIGILAIAKGVLTLTLAKKKIKSLLDSMVDKSPKEIRKYVLIKIALGVALIYAA
jgi:uncharacterized protein YjeT (DUF2065 family)